MTNAKLSELKVGDVVKVKGFTCMAGIRPVNTDENGLYVACDHGRHYLDGQLGMDGDTLVGVEIYNA